MKRAEKRKQLEDFNIACEMLKTLKHFFPGLINQLKNVKDPRNQSYIKYNSEEILLVQILASIFQISSMRNITNEFNKSAAIENIKILTGNENLTEIPHFNTINNFLKDFEPQELEKIINEMVTRLIRMRMFDNSRIRDKYWQVIIDGSQLFTFSEKHCDHCLVKTHNKGTDKEYKEYYHCVLEAKLVLYNEIVISIGTEFIENETPDVSKQDCELSAFYRLAKKIKTTYPKLPIIVTVDSLYACDNFFITCEENNWQYIVRFKDGSIQTVAKEFKFSKYLNSENIRFEFQGKKSQQFWYVIGIKYKKHEFNMLELSEAIIDKDKCKNKNFVFITSLPINTKNYESLAIQGRRRWKIENEGFNEQKNHGFFIKHLFSKDYNGIKNHYL